MPRLVADGATLRCSMGAAPSTLRVVRAISADEHPLATVLDHAPSVNILPFGACSSPSNPQVAAATAAAQGVLTPQPCVPVTSAPWTDGSPHVTHDGHGALTTRSRCACQWAGTVTVVDAGNAVVDDG